MQIVFDEFGNIAAFSIKAALDPLQCPVFCRESSRGPPGSSSEPSRLLSLSLDLPAAAGPWSCPLWLAGGPKGPLPRLAKGPKGHLGDKAAA